jgi:hypothetical protein
VKPPSISVIAEDSPAILGTSESRLPERLTVNLKSYQHVIAAVGGFWSARVGIGASIVDMDDWLTNGLGRRITAYSPSLDKIWDGFVNGVSINFGPVSLRRGRLLEVANRVAVTYSTIFVDPDTGEVIVGTRPTTPFADDTTSQNKYGIIEKVLSTAGVDEENQGEASLIRDTFLEEHKLPKTTRSMSLTGESSVSVSLECLGFVHWLHYVYNTTTTGTINASAKVIDILGAGPNTAWLAFGTSNVEANTVQVNAWEDENRKAFSLLKSITAKGDASYNRWLFGIYENMQAYYHQAPQELEYIRRISSQRVAVSRVGGGLVQPWDIRPGKWIATPDFVPTQKTPLRVGDDPRAMFIETVSYTMPDQVSITGGTVDTLPQILGQLGLSGVGA